MSGVVLIISGPSGVGKTTVAAELVEDERFARVVTATTRPPRDGERDGVDYHFLSAEAFEEGVHNRRFLEYAEVHGRRYGTPRAEVTRLLEEDRTVVLTIDVQGMKLIRENAADLPVVTVFLTAPSREILLERLGNRGSESGEEIAVRLETAERELAAKDLYDHIVVNDDLGRAVEEIRSIAAKATGRAEKRL